MSKVYRNAHIALIAALGLLLLAVESGALTLLGNNAIMFGSNGHFVGPR